MERLLDHASLIETLALLGAFLCVALWERASPHLSYEAVDRWRLSSNIGLMLINHAVPYLLLPVTAALAAWVASAHAFGILNGHGLRLGVLIVIAVLAIDFVGWAVHLAMHRFGPLWRIHQVHHSDVQFDSLLGFRFHPAEVFLQALANAVAVALLGLPVEAVLISALITNSHNFFGHANASLNRRAERWLQMLVVTPDVHRVHHSSDATDFTQNFGIVFTWWDRLAGTYRAPVGNGPSNFGLDAPGRPAGQSLGRLLVMPLSRL